MFKTRVRAGWRRCSSFEGSSVDGVVAELSLRLVACRLPSAPIRLVPLRC